MKIEKDRALIRADGKDCVTAIDSSAFAGGNGWRQIDEGYGDAYRHAQGDDRVKSGVWFEDWVKNNRE